MRKQQEKMQAIEDKINKLTEKQEEKPLKDRLAQTEALLRQSQQVIMDQQPMINMLMELQKEGTLQRLMELQ